jgi:hypothetical protein
MIAKNHMRHTEELVMTFYHTQNSAKFPPKEVDMRATTIGLGTTRLSF